MDSQRITVSNAAHNDQNILFAGGHVGDVNSLFSRAFPAHITRKQNTGKFF